VIFSRTFGPITGAMPTPPPDRISLRVGVSIEGIVTIFEFDFTQHGFPIIFEDFTGVNDG